MGRQIYAEEHDIFRAAFTRYLEKEVVPHLETWEEQGDIPREAWTKMGAQGYICPWLEEKYGGSEAGFEYSIIINEEMSRVRANGFSVGLHSDIVVPYIHSFGSEEQKEKWLPGCTTGETVLAVAMTEPDAGSDLQGIRTRAVKDGDHYVINGQKTFISNGYCCDLAVVACKTDPAAKPAYRGISLIAVEAGTPGFIKGRRLQKMGLHIQDTAELFFEDCRVPATNLLGQEGRGFYYLMDKLQQERLIAIIRAQVGSEEMLKPTVEYTKQRQAFGKPISAFQHNAFKLAEMATEVELGRTFFDDLLADHLEGKNIVSKVSMAKWWIAEMCNRVAYQCLQLHGGYGFMDEYPISRWYRDVRAIPIYAGSTEIMKQVIAKGMGLL